MLKYSQSATRITRLAKCRPGGYRLRGMSSAWLSSPWCRPAGCRPGECRPRDRYPTIGYYLLCIYFIKYIIQPSLHPLPPHHSTPPPPYSCSTRLQRFHIIIARYCHIARWLQHQSSTTGSACIVATAGCAG